MDLRQQVQKHLEIERQFGVSELPSRSPAPRSAPAAGGDRHEKSARLEALKKEYAGCQLCPLGATRTNLVFGIGNPDARLMFVGEAPGFEEDRQGFPFVGAAGQLLTKIIQAMKMAREDVYIANCLKCRPPQNRNPLPTEIATCSPILQKQIEIIRPRVICALGKFAAQTLLGTEEPISRLRGRFFDWKSGAKLIATFHPAYLLRNPDDKKLVWEDMKKIMQELAT
jgi:uracil-DNA glycosylase